MNFNKSSLGWRARCQRLLAAPVLLLIRAYQLLLSPLLGNNCRFYPSCSHYAYSVIAEYGIVRGGWLAGKRLLRCQPFCAGGVDLPPQKTDSPASAPSA